MIAWYWMLAAFLAGGIIGWMIYFLMAVDKALDLEYTPDEVRRWFARMDREIMSSILYPMVKTLYNGRRTIHRCPTRKGKTINLLDQKGE